MDLPVTPIGAAVDVGSNSAHLLVAQAVPSRDGGLDLAARADESVFLGLGERVGATGHLGGEARAAVAAALAGYAASARAHGAPEGAILLLGTEPIRRAADAGRLALAVERETGLPLHVVDHEEEGLLTLLGVTGGRPVDARTAIVDSGGGSTELVIVGPDGRHEARGIRLGSASLAAAAALADPPSPASVAAMRETARAALAALPVGTVERAIAVGGSASNLAKVIPGAREDRRLSRERLAAALEELLATPAAALVARYGLNPRRAPLMAAGLVIVDALLERLGVPELTVREEGIREGAILAACLAGAGWRDRLAALATGSGARR